MSVIDLRHGFISFPPFSVNGFVSSPNHAAETNAMTRARPLIPFDVAQGRKIFRHAKPTPRRDEFPQKTHRPGHVGAVREPPFAARPDPDIFARQGPATL
jgi:hypothetical protein